MSWNPNCNNPTERQRSRTSISSIVASPYSFNGLFTALRECMQLEEEIKSAKSDGISPDLSSTFFRSYGRNPRHARTLKQGRGNDKIQKLDFFLKR